jgi:hypothetical protein
MRANEINEILDKCDIPMPSRERLLEIAKIEGKSFETALVAAEKNDPWARVYLANVVKAVAPFCRNTVTAVGITVDLAGLVRVAKEEGATFFKALNAYHQSQSAVAKAYLTDLFQNQERPASTTPPWENEQGSAPDPDQLPNFSTAHVPQRPVAGQSTSTVISRTPEKVARNVNSPAQTAMPAQIAKPAPVIQSEPPPKLVGNAGDPPFFSFKVFGSKAALCFSEDTTRSGNLPTIRIEAAPKGSDGKGVWSRKIAIQLTRQELYHVLAVFVNELEAMQVIHGNKFLTLEYQETNFYLRLAEKGGASFAVPIDGVAPTQVRNLLSKQILAEDRHLTLDGLHQELGRIGSMAANAVAAKQRRSA